jgi:hypothetical protein
MRGHLIVLGLVLGMVCCWVWIAVSLILGIGVAYGNDSSVPAVLGLVLAALPVVVGIVLLVVPKTRQLGAGFLMGISIGFIVGAGVCASLFVPGTFEL